MSSTETAPTRSARRRFGTSLAALVGGSMLLAATSTTGIAGSADGPTLSITPTSGPIGTVVSVTGTCTPTEGTPTIQMQQNGVNVFIISRDVQLTSDGHLTGTLVIPAEHPLTPLDQTLTVPVEPGDAFTVAATCDTTGADYFTAPDDFVVTEAPSTTVTSTTTTSMPATTTSPPSSSTAPTTLPAGSEPSVHSSQASVAPGGSLTLSGDGFAPGTALDIELHSTPVHLATTTSQADGAYSATVTIPADAAPGTHSIVVAGRGIDGAMRQVTTTITVTAVAGPTTTGPTGNPGPATSADPAEAVAAAPSFTG